MKPKDILTTSDDELREFIESCYNEIEYLELKKAAAETELFFRKHPECRKT